MFLLFQEFGCYFYKTMLTKFCPILITYLPNDDFSSEILPPFKISKKATDNLKFQKVMKLSSSTFFLIKTLLQY